MEYDEVPKNYHSPYMVQVLEKLNILKMTPEERANYSYYLKKLYNDRDEMQTAEAIGIEKGKTIGEAIGIEKGEAREIEKTTINMLKQNLDFKLISSITGFSIDELLKLKNRL